MMIIPAGLMTVMTDASAEEETFHIGIVTGSVSQSEDDRRGAEAFQQKYGADRVSLAIYPDNFTEETEKTIRNTLLNGFSSMVKKQPISAPTMPILSH